MSWQIKKLGELVSIVTGKLDANAAIQGGKFPFYTCSRDASEINETAFDGESILLSGNGIFSVKYHKSGKFNAYQRVYVIKTLDDNYVFLPYVYNFLIIEVPKLISQGAVIKYLRLPQLTDLEISLPSLSEQKKIVKMLNEKMGKIAEAKKLREASLADTEKILSQTLSEIFEEGKQKGWEEKNINEIATSVDYGTSEKTKDNDDVPVLRMNNIQEGNLDYLKLKYLSKKAKDLPKLYLKDNTLLFNRTNSFELVGKSALYRGEENKYTFASYLIRVEFDKDKAVPALINYYINSEECRKEQIEPGITKQVGQANFNGTKLKNIKILLPLLAEQKKIVKRLDILSAKVRKSIELQKSQLEDLKKLEKSYLHEAFTGGL